MAKAVIDGERSERRDQALRLGGGVGAGVRGGRAVLDGGVALDRIIDLTAMDGDLLGGLNAQSHFVAANLDDDNRDVIVDDDAFVLLPRQHQHDGSPFAAGKSEKLLGGPRARGA